MAQSAPTFAPRADSLDDFHVAEEFAFYARVTAALEFLLRGTATPERVFQLYELSEEDLRRFYRSYPRETEELKAAYEAAFCLAYGGRSGCIFAPVPANVRRIVRRPSIFTT